jgi:hypothetical protein
VGKKYKKSLKPRQRKFIQAVIAGGTLKDAALAAGYNKNAPGQAGSQALRHIAANGSGTDLLDREGLSDRALVTMLKKLLDATETKFFQQEGKVTERVIVSDNTTRRFALEMAFRIKGLFKAEAEAQATGVKVILIDRANRPPRAPAINIPTLQIEELEKNAGDN